MLEVLSPITPVESAEVTEFCSPVINHICSTHKRFSLTQFRTFRLSLSLASVSFKMFNPYPTVFPYGNGMVLHFYKQQESSTTKTVHKVINKGLKTYV